MDLIEPIWEQGKPTDSDVEVMWRELEIRHDVFQHPAVDEVLNHLREMRPNGGALFAQFHISQHPTFHWFASRNRFWEMNFFQRFLSSPPVTAAMPELEIEATDFPDPGFELGNSFTLDGEIGWTLVWGGAYAGFTGTPREQRILVLVSATACSPTASWKFSFTFAINRGHRGLVVLPGTQHGSV